MVTYKVDYYEQIVHDTLYYAMSVVVPVCGNVLLTYSIDPRDYDADGFIEDENGAYFDEEAVEEACFKTLRDHIIQQAEYLGIDPGLLVFSRLRVNSGGAENDT